MWDVIVVGAGTAGIPCALEAANSGALVLLIDKAQDIGGTLHISSGHMAGAGSRRQRARGIVDTPDDHFADIMRISQDTSRPEIVRLAVDLCGPTLDWLEDQGFEFAPETPRIVYGHEPYTTARTVYGPEGGHSILSVLRRLLSEAVSRNAIALRLSTAVDTLVIEDGRCVGVVLKDGEVLQAGAVALCTGGYGYNPDLFRQIEGLELATAAWETSTGDGLIMAMAAGAGLAGKGAYLPTFGGLPPASGFAIPWEDRPNLVAQERPPFEIYVGRHGRRWVAEDDPSIDAKEHGLRSLDGMRFWMVLEASGLRASSPVVSGWDAEELDRRANHQAGVSRADTLAGLAALTGIDPAGLKASVRRYNEAVAKGVDPEFGRTFLPAPIATGPFYAIENLGITLRTSAGVAIDDELRVVTEAGEPIAGLFAAGEIIGAAAIAGRSFCSGTSSTPAMAFGRRLGARLAAAPKAG